MLCFIKVEKNRMIPITSMEPMNAPIMTDRNPDKVNTPAVIVPAPASMTKATPKLAPELIPSMEGSAKGLLNVVCNISPDAASAIPQRRAVMACGRDVYGAEQQVGSCQCKDEEEQYDTVFCSFVIH